MTCPFIYTLPLAVSELQQQSWAGVTKTTGPESLKLTPWPFKEKDRRPLAWSRIGVRSGRKYLWFFRRMSSDISHQVEGSWDEDDPNTDLCEHHEDGRVPSEAGVLKTVEVLGCKSSSHYVLDIVNHARREKNRGSREELSNVCPGKRCFQRAVLVRCPEVLSRQDRGVLVAGGHMGGSLLSGVPVTKSCSLLRQGSALGGFPGGAVLRNPPANGGDAGLHPGLGRSHMPWSN